MLHLDENTLVSGLRRVAGGDARPPGGPRRRAAATLSVVAVLAVSLLLFHAAGQAADRLLEATWRPVTTAAAPAAGDEIEIATDKAVTASPDPLEVVRASLGTGGTLAAALERLGVPGERRAEVVRHIARVVDPRRLSKRTGLTALVDENGVPRTVSLRSEPERFLRLTLPDDDATPIRSEVIKLPVVTSLETLGGVVETSVAQAFSHARQGVHITNAFADVFQWDVDLLIDPRPGDTVRIVYEAQRLGDVPRDLPDFGGKPSRSGDFLQLGRVLAASYEGTMARSSGFWIDGPAGAGGYYDDRGRPLRKAFLKSPLNYRRISSGFTEARRHPVTRKVVPHHGVDFAAATGTPVVATADGRVTRAGWKGALGKSIRLSHGGTYSTIYGHLSGFASGIRPGVEVRQNQVIGYVGSTGRATGPHLHYTLVRAGRPINPLTFDNPPSAPLPEQSAWRLDEAKRRWLPVLYAIDLARPAPDFTVAQAPGPILRPGF